MCDDHDWDDELGTPDPLGHNHAHGDAGQAHGHGHAHEHHHDHHHGHAHDDAFDNVGDGHHEEDPAVGWDDPSRRLVLGSALAALTAPLLLRGGQAAAAEPSDTSGQLAVVAAMHVHASFSEQEGSWQGQAVRAAEDGVDLMFMTDHSHRLLATELASTLGQTTTNQVTSGSLARARGRMAGDGSFSVYAEAAGSTAASAGIEVNGNRPGNRDLFRSSVLGQVVRHRFGNLSVPLGGLYEIRFGLSHHTPSAGRPDGTYELCFRFGSSSVVRRSTENRGRTAVVELPLPANGSTVDMDLEAECARAWPDLVPADNATQGVTLCAVSPRAGVYVQVDSPGVEFVRARRTPAALRQVQQEMADRYGTSRLRIQPAIELGDKGHHNAFTETQFFAADEELSKTDPAAYVRANVEAVHRVGGVVSWNHPFVVSVGQPVSGPTADARRRQIFTKLNRTDVYGVDILEVGYARRGGMDIDQHLALWDSFSRNARFLTGNGVSDSHDSSLKRSRAANQFATGIWADSVGTADVVTGLRGGRAYTRHLGTWVGGELDLVVDGSILMGQVAVGSATSRRLDITATNLPSGSVVQVVGGPVDDGGADGPGTSVVATLPATAFRTSGRAAYQLTVPGPSFVRLTVRASNGEVIGISNPVWFLTRPPRGGIPAARLAG